MARQKSRIPNPYLLKKLALEVLVSYKIESGQNLEKSDFYLPVTPELRNTLAKEIFAKKKKTLSKLFGTPYSEVKNEGVSVNTLNDFVAYADKSKLFIRNWSEFKSDNAIPNDIANELNAEGKEYCYFIFLPEELKEKINATIWSYYSKGEIVNKDFHTLNFHTLSNKLFGRKQAYRSLTSFLSQREKKFACVYGGFGLGKTSLVSNFISHIKSNNFYSIDTVFAWSFNYQNSEDSNANGESFLIQIAKFYKVNLEQYITNADKARAVAIEISKAKNLIVLDGLEALEYTEHYELLDEIILAFLKSLDAFNNVTCIITCRHPLHNLNTFNCEIIRLQNLDYPEALELLESFKIKGSLVKKNKFLEDVKYHPYSIILLCKNILKKYNKDIEALPLFSKESIEKQISAQSTIDILFSLNSTKHEELISFLSCFYQKLDFTMLLSSLTFVQTFSIFNNVLNLDNDSIIDALKELDELGLINFSYPNIYIYPSVSLHFKTKLRRFKKKVWCEVQTALYRFYQKIPSNNLPTTLEEMAPLFLAVKHGCNARLFDATIQDVYYTRINHGDKMYCFKVLGAISSELELLRNYYKLPFRQIHKNIDSYGISYIYNSTGTSLNALNRIGESTIVTKKALSMAEDSSDFHNASINSNNLSESFVAMGDKRKTKLYGKLSVKYAEKTKEDNDTSRHKFEKLELMHFRCAKYLNLSSAMYVYDEIELCEKYLFKATSIIENNKLMSIRGWLMFKVLQYYFANNKLAAIEKYIDKADMKEALHDKGFHLSSQAQLLIFKNDLHGARTKAKTAIYYFKKSHVKRFLPVGYIFKIYTSLKLKIYDSIEEDFQLLEALSKPELTYYYISYLELKRMFKLQINKPIIASEIKKEITIIKDRKEIINTIQIPKFD